MEGPKGWKPPSHAAQVDGLPPAPCLDFSFFPLVTAEKDDGGQLQSTCKLIFCRNLGASCATRVPFLRECQASQSMDFSSKPSSTLVVPMLAKPMPDHSQILFSI